MRNPSRLWILLATAIVFLSASTALADPVTRLSGTLSFSPTSTRPFSSALTAEPPLAVISFVETGPARLASQAPDLITPAPPAPNAPRPSLPTPRIRDAFFQSIALPDPDIEILLCDLKKKSAPAEPVEDKNREIKIFPSLITFFCNPYALASRKMADMGRGFRMDSLEEIHLGFMGQIEDVRIALFSTVSMCRFREDPHFTDREKFLQDKMTHRFSFLLSVSPLPHMYVGAASGAQVVDKPRAYIFEFLLEARLRF